MPEPIPATKSLEEAMEALELCLLCRSRLLRGSLFHGHQFPKELRGQIEKVQFATTTCALCLGLCEIFSSQESENEVLMKIVMRVKESGLDFTSFHMNVSEPVNLALRDHAFWVYVRDKCKDSGCSKIIDVLEEEAVPAKIVFRNFVNNRLEELFSEELTPQPSLFPDSKQPPPWFDPATERVDLLVTFELPPAPKNDTGDTKSLLAALRRHCNRRDYLSLVCSGEPRRRRNKQRRFEGDKGVHQPADAVEKGQGKKEAPEQQVFRTSLKKLLRLLPDEVVIKEVINFEAEKVFMGDGAGPRRRVRLASVDVTRSAVLVVGGRYAKLSRSLSQTPWRIDGERKHETSVEELIAAPVLAAFQNPSSPPTTFTFISSGREDVDVRCLGLGRPFALELSNYGRTLRSLLEAHAEERGDSENPNDLSWLANIINNSTRCRVFVRDLQVVSTSSVRAALKVGEVEKRKRYRALCWCPDGGLTTARVRQLDARLREFSRPSQQQGDVPEQRDLEWPPPASSAEFQQSLGCDVAYVTFGTFSIEQRTPIRVLHRRSLLTRKRDVIWMRLAHFETNVMKEGVAFLVFVRELISNASDAVERLRFLQTSGKVSGSDRPLEIHITTDEDRRTLTIADNGIGMTAEEMEKNLGTIAKSGSREYVAQIKQSNASPQDTSNIIGQFGVGFYAAFMVADKVEVQSMSQAVDSDHKGHIWVSKGVDGTYSIVETQEIAPGTKIILYLRDDSLDFAKSSVVQSVIQKYSNFIGVPVFLDGKQVNVVDPLWTKDPSKISEGDFKSFYQFISGNGYDTPRYRITFNTDSPINIRSLLFVPSMRPSIFETSKEDCSLSLYSRKTLIMSRAERLLPRWLRFVRGVVDSEDIPLNLSRELLQDHGLIREINRILTSRILRNLENESKRNPREFCTFLNDYGIYLKEGIVSELEQSIREEIAKLLRFETSALPAGETTSFDEYASRMRAGERNIYFLAAPSRELAEASPYFEAIKKNRKDAEVLFLYEPYDELVLMNMGQYDRKNLVSIEKVLAEDAFDTNTVGKEEADCISQEEAEKLSRWAEQTLGTKVKKVKVTQRLSQHPCCVQLREAGAMRHLLRTSLMGRPSSEKYLVMEPILELNPRHPLVHFLARLVGTSGPTATAGGDAVLATALVDHLLDAALAHAGLLDEAREMAARTSQLLTLLAERIPDTKV